MHKKMARLWRYLRTPVLLTSATILVIGCASKNPLIDEADPTETTEPVSARRKIEPAQKEDPITQDLAVTQAPERKMAERAPQKENAEPENELNSKPTGLKKWLTMLSPYKVNIQQGNFISSEMLAKIQPGMTKEQVRFVLGTPLLTDMFHAGRWDYLFRLQKPNGATTTNRVTIFFSDNLVDRIIGDNLPSEAEYLSHITSDDEPSEKTVKEKETDSEKSAIEKPTGQPAVVDTPSGSAAEPEQVTTAEPDSGTAPNTQPVAATSPEPVRATETPHVPVPVDTPEPVRKTTTVRPAETTSGLKPSSSRVRIPKPVSAPATDSSASDHTQETVKTPESVRATEPTRTDRASRPVSTPLPARAPEPASAPEPVSAPVPAMETDTEKRPARQAPVRQTMAVDTDDVDENVSSGNIGTFEPISTPSRIGKMLPVSPNDELIGNIQ